MTLFRSAYENNLLHFAELLDCCRELSIHTANFEGKSVSLADMEFLLHHCRSMLSQVRLAKKQLDAATVERAEAYKRVKVLLPILSTELSNNADDGAQQEIIRSIEAFSGVQRIKSDAEQTTPVQKNIDSYSKGYEEVADYFDRLILQLKALPHYRPGNPAIGPDCLAQQVNRVRETNAAVLAMHQTYSMHLQELNALMYASENSLMHAVAEIRKCIRRKADPSHPAYLRAERLRFRRKSIPSQA